MPILGCSVVTCHHNVDERCSLDKIQVEGKNADATTETSCASFKARKENRCCNTVGMPDARSTVKCQAVHCKYNQNETCDAGNVRIEGNNACECTDTKCGSFCCK